MKIYREAGGCELPCSPTSRSIWPNRPGAATVADGAHTSLICSPDEARERFKRIEQLGFDEVLLVSHAGVLDDLLRARDWGQGLNLGGCHA